MKFPRHSRLLRGPFDLAPFAAVLFLLVLFLMLTALLPVPGLPVSLTPPVADNMPGIERPTLAMAVDSGGRLYFDNQMVSPEKLRTALKNAARRSPQATLIIHADQTVSYAQLVNLTLLARDVGIPEVWLATLPRAIPDK